MKTFVPYEKRGKKQKRALDAQKRASWGEINPITRRPPNPRAYDRKKEARRVLADNSRRGGFLWYDTQPKHYKRKWLISIDKRGLPMYNNFCSQAMCL